MNNRRRNCRKYKMEKKVKTIPYDNVVEFDFEKIKEIARKNRIKVFLKCDGKVLEFISKYGDRWITPIEPNIIRLYHYTSDGKNHFQNVYRDYEYMLNVLNEHDWFNKKVRGCNSVDYVIYKYNKGLIPNVEMN